MTMLLNDLTICVHSDLCYFPLSYFLYVFLGQWLFLHFEEALWEYIESVDGYKNDFKTEPTI